MGGNGPQGFHVACIEIVFLGVLYNKNAYPGKTPQNRNCQDGLERLFVESRYQLKKRAFLPAPFANRPQFFKRLSSDAFTEFEPDFPHGLGIQALVGCQNQLLCVVDEEINGTDRRFHMIGNDADHFLQKALQIVRLFEDAGQFAHVAY